MVGQVLLLQQTEPTLAACSVVMVAPSYPRLHAEWASSACQVVVVSLYLTKLLCNCITPHHPTCSVMGSCSSSSRGSALNAARPPALLVMIPRLLATWGLPGAELHSALATIASVSLSTAPRVVHT